MRRSPLVALAVAALVACPLAGCGDDGDASSSSTTTDQAVPTDAATELVVCAPLASLNGIFVDLNDVATGSAEGRAAADATLSSALDQLEEVVPERSEEVQGAVDTLRDVSFQEPDGPDVPSDEEADAALATLVDDLGGPCGPLGGG